MVAVILSATVAGALDSLSIGLLVPLLAVVQSGDSGDGSIPAAVQLFTGLFNTLGIEPTFGMVVTGILIAITGKNLLLLITFGAAHRLSSRILANVRLEIATQLMNVGMTFHDQRRASDLADIWYNKARTLETILGTGVNFGANALTALALFLLLFVLSWKLTLIAGLLCLLGAVLLRWHTRKISIAGSRLASSERTLMATMHDALSGIRLIRTTGAAPNVLRLLDRRNQDHARQLARGNFLAFAMQPAADLLGSIGIAALALLALGMLEMPPAAALTILLPFLYVLLRLVPIARQLSHQRGRIAHLWPNVAELRHLLRTDDKPAIIDGLEPFKGLTRELRFDNVTFAYAGDDTPVLNQASFTIPAGRTTAIIGETGSGKSTIANLLLRLYDPDSGRILADDTPLTHFQLASLHDRMGIVDQETTLFNDTIRGNLEFTARRTPTEDELIRAASMAGIHTFIEGLPRGYDTVIGDRGVRLSGGQRQRLAIARTLLRDPEILILDEATSALDNRTELWIRESIERISAERTLVIIAHRLTTIEHADHVIVLRRGHVAESGPLSMIKRSGDEYARLAANEKS